MAGAVNELGSIPGSGITGVHENPLGPHKPEVAGSRPAGVSNFLVANIF